MIWIIAPCVSALDSRIYYMLADLTIWGHSVAIVSIIVVDVTIRINVTDIITITNVRSNIYTAITH